MIYRLLADTVALAHAAFVVFVVVGGFLVLRWRWITWLHIPAAIWGAFVELSGRVCPLTPLEIALRARAGEAGYAGGFVDHYVIGTLYPAGLTRGVQWILGGVVIAINVAAYVRVVHHRRRRPTP